MESVRRGGDPNDCSSLSPHVEAGAEATDRNPATRVSTEDASVSCPRVEHCSMVRMDGVTPSSPKTYSSQVPITSGPSCHPSCSPSAEAWDSVLPCSTWLSWPWPPLLPPQASGSGSISSSFQGESKTSFPGYLSPPF